MLKNKKEREDFIKNYQSWELIYNLEEIQVKIYKKQLNTGAIIYVTEFQDYISWKKEFVTGVRYHLVLDTKDEYKSLSASGYECHISYDPNGDSQGMLVDYLTKNRGVLEVSR